MTFATLSDSDLCDYHQYAVDAAPVAVGDIMVGGTISRVQESRHPDYKVGEDKCRYVEKELGFDA